LLLLPTDIDLGKVDGPTLCRKFDEATSGRERSRYLSSDWDPLFQYHRWQAIVRVPEFREIKSLPDVPMFHPFVDRQIASIRRELPELTLNRNATGMENKLRDHQCYDCCDFHCP